MSFFKKLLGLNDQKISNDQNTNGDSKALKEFEELNGLYPIGVKDLDQIERIIRSSTIKHWRFFAYKANFLEEIGKLEEAIESYSTAIELTKNESLVYALFHQIGYCYLGLGNNLKAEEYYTKALNLKSQHPNNSANPDLEGLDGGVLLGVKKEKIYNNRGNARKNLKKYEEALEDCEMALKINSFYPNSYLLKGQIKYEQGDINSAKQLIKKAGELGNNSAIKLLQEIEKIEYNQNSSNNKNQSAESIAEEAFKLCDSGNYHEVIRLGHVLLNEHKSPMGHYILGLVYTLLEKYDMALDHCRDSLKYFQNEPNNLNRLGVCYCCLGNILQGLEYFKYGSELGDQNCRQNYNYWVNQI